MDIQLVKEIAIPVVAFGIGATLRSSERTAVPSMLAMFFGAQTGMNLYMKEVLSGVVVSEEEGLKGIPSAFLVTAIQQLVAFVLFAIVLLISRFTNYKYSPRQLTTSSEWLAVLLFSVSFTMNIALNNYSISLLPLSVNLIIRSCLPLATFISQQTASKCTNEAAKDARPLELVLMIAGILCAAGAVIAESHADSRGHGESKTLVYGIVVCIASLFSGAINLALAGVLGTTVSLNSLDTTVYMSIPAFLILSGPSLLYRHPVSTWPGHGDMTDLEILVKVLELRPAAISLVAISGVMALFYNVLQYSIVQKLSASYTAFTGNFNKAATIALGLMVGLESLPPGNWGLMMVLACIGNIGAFTAFNVVKAQAAQKPEPDQEAVASSDDESSSSVISGDYEEAEDSLSEDAGDKQGMYSGRWSFRESRQLGM